MKKFPIYLCTLYSLFIITFLASCGGGGGGGGGAGSISRPESGIRIIHASLDTSPLELYIQALSPASLSKVNFSRSSSYVELSAGNSQVVLSHVGFPSNIEYKRTVSINKGDVKSLLIYGEHSLPAHPSTGQKFALLDDTLPQDIDSTRTYIRVIHAVVGAASISSVLGEVLIDSDLVFGKASSYINISPGTLSIRSKRKVDGATVYRANLTLEPGVVYSLVVKGEAQYLVVGELLVDS